MHVCGGHVVRMDYSAYPADCMEFVTIIEHLLGSAIAFGRSCRRVVVFHRASAGSSHLAGLDRLGVYDKGIFATVHLQCYLLANILAQNGCQLATRIVLPTGYEVGNPFPGLVKPFE